ncbi:HutD family protein [Streptomyces misionensis]|uniref:HutD family protein n=1 Tax=Streptomyces misionensis TaxID=67331 RepID=A0A5C6IYP3_9ACTN|nr:HutD family protein [Streptomyces misionensis]TWV34186.1 HutD family protein [Streptomyces misionensis]
MTVRVLRADGRPAAPWKNGGGLTREIAAAPVGAGTSDFAWRVSLADVDRGGPFSRFEGVERIITLVDGPGMVLTVDGTPHTVAERYVPFAFPGDAATDCRLLGGPLVDFNVMTRRGRAAARVEIVRGRRAFSAPAGGTLLAVVLEGSAVLETAGGALGRLDAALTDDPGDEALAVSGVAALVTLTRTAAT